MNNNKPYKTIELNYLQYYNLIYALLDYKEKLTERKEYMFYYITTKGFKDRKHIDDKTNIKDAEYIATQINNEIGVDIDAINQMLNKLSWSVIE